MQVNIKSKNLRVKPADEALMRKKVERLARYLEQLSDAEVIVGEEKTKTGPERTVVQLTVRANGTLLRAEEEDSELLSAFDAAIGKIERRIERFKGRARRRKGAMPTSIAVVAAPNGAEPAAEDGDEAEEEQRPIVRTKQFTVRPMSHEDAVEQMELLGHNFFVFFDPDTKRMSVLYRRNDGDYGVLQPELA